MAKEKKLIKDTILYGVANFGSSILNFLMLPLYTFYFTTSEYGLWDVVVTTATLLTPFLTFELVSATYRWLITENNEQKRKIVITTGTLSIVRNVAVFNVLAIILFLFVSLPYQGLALLFINVTIVTSFLQQCARGLGRNMLFASMGIIQTAIVVLLNLYFILVLQLRVEAFFYAFIIAGVLVSLFAWIRLRFHQYLDFSTYSKGQLKDFLTYSIPIIPGAASWWVMTMSDRYFITAYLGMDFNGIYAVANKIPALLLMISSVFFLAWKDSAIIEFDSQDKDAYYSFVFKHFFRLMGTSVVCLILFTKPLLQFVIAADFFSAWKYIGILLLGTFFHALSLFWSAGFHGAKQTNIILTTSVIGAVVNVIVNFLFIQTIGLYAVVLSSFLAFLITWIIRVIYAKPHFHIKNPVQDMIVLFSLMTIAVLVPFTLTDTGLYLAILASIVVFLAYNRDIIRYVYRLGRSTLAVVVRRSS